MSNVIKNTGDKSMAKIDVQGTEITVLSAHQED